MRKCLQTWGLAVLAWIAGGPAWAGCGNDVLPDGLCSWCLSPQPTIWTRAEQAILCIASRSIYTVFLPLVFAIALIVGLTLARRAYRRET